MFDLFEAIADAFAGIGRAESEDDSKGPWDELFVGLADREPVDGFMEAIKTWEGLFQKMPEDVGNWVRLPSGKRRLIGTMRGVTPAALALHRGIKPWELTEADMKALTLREAAEIGVKHYYEAPGFNRLPYVPATDVLVDCGWGSGPFTAVRWMQRLIDVEADGKIGPITINAYVDWLREKGHADAVRAVHAYRRAFYTRISRPGTRNAKFRKGWYNRADYYLPDTKWWKGWQA